jgi:hypothetical protein
LPERGRAGAAPDRNPDVSRKLRADAVKRERGEQTDHAVGYGPRRHGQAVVLGDRTARQAVLAAGYPLEDTLGHEPREMLA